MPPGTVGDGGDHPGMTVAGPVSRRSRMAEGPGSVLGSGPPVLLLSWVAAASLGYRKIAVSQLMDVGGFKEIGSGKLQDHGRPWPAHHSVGCCREGGLLEKLED